MQHFDIDALSTVVAVTDCASFTGAAEQLHKTQAAISFTIARLEQRVGSRLFERSRRGAVLTPAGEVLAGYARRILALETEALAAVLGPANSGRIRLGVPDDYLDRFVTGPVDSFMAIYKRVQVEVICDFSRKLESMVQEGLLDLAVITRGGGQKGEFLRMEEQFWCAASDHAPERADPLPLALFPEQCRARPMILRALDDVGRRWRIAYSCSHLAGICAAVARGSAVSVLPASTMPKPFRRLGPEDGLPALPPLEIALLMPEHAHAVTRPLAAALRQSFGAG